MILLRYRQPDSVEDAQELLQTAIGVEFGTLPPYLYSLYTILPGTNAEAERRIKSVALQEMIHMCLACNMLNAIGGTPRIQAQAYPGPLPGDIGPDGKQLKLHLYPFSQAAMQQAMDIEQPEEKPEFPVVTEMLEAPGTEKAVAIGQYYALVETALSQLPASAWQANRNQITDDQFFTGRLFAINTYADAHKAITEIVSEGEGSQQGTVSNPLDFEDDIAHYYRFGEVFHDRVLTKAATPEGYQWGPARLGVDWAGAYPAIADPALHDFCKDSAEAQAAQLACNRAFTEMVDALQLAVTGSAGALGQAVGAMFQLRLAAKRALLVPLADGKSVAGPAFHYQGKGGHGA